MPQRIDHRRPALAAVHNFLLWKSLLNSFQQLTVAINTSQHYNRHQHNEMFNLAETHDLFVF